MHRDKYPHLSADKKNFIKFLVLLLCLAVMVVVTIRLLPWAMSLRDAEARAAFTEQVAQWGVRGWFVMLGIQVLQVVIALIPGEPIEIISGMLFGTVGGTLTCLLGILIGTVIIFCLVKWLGMGFLSTFFQEEKLGRLSFLLNEQKLRTTVFLLFFIPGTPKDLLTYFVPATRMKAQEFFVIAVLARIPSVASSCFLGDKLMDGSWVTSMIVFAVTTVIGIIGIFCEKKIVAWRQSRAARRGTSPKES